MTVYFSHATSFCGAVWDPVREALGDMPTVAWDHPGHGSGPPLEPPFDWTVFADWALEATEPGGVGVGHSMGATVLTLAQLADPNRFRALVLVEPIIFPGTPRRYEGDVVEVALKRRATFASRTEAFRHLGGRDAFADWHEDALRGYIECGFAGSGPVALACSPEVEAETYRGSFAHDTWHRARSINVPVLVMSGAESQTVDPDTARAQSELFPRGGLEIVPEAGHFLPMQSPGLIAERVRRLAEVVSRR